MSFGAGRLNLRSGGRNGGGLLRRGGGCAAAVLPGALNYAVHRRVEESVQTLRKVQVVGPAADASVLDGRLCGFPVGSYSNDGATVVSRIEFLLVQRHDEIRGYVEVAACAHASLEVGELCTCTAASWVEPQTRRSCLCVHGTYDVRVPFAMQTMCGWAEITRICCMVEGRECRCIGGGQAAEGHLEYESRN